MRFWLSYMSLGPVWGVCFIEEPMSRILMLKVSWHWLLVVSSWLPHSGCQTLTLLKRWGFRVVPTRWVKMTKCTAAEHQQGVSSSVRKWSSVVIGSWSGQRGGNSLGSAVSRHWLLTIRSLVDRASEGLHSPHRLWNQHWRKVAEVQQKHTQRRCRWGSHGQLCYRRRQCQPHSPQRSQFGVEVLECGAWSEDWYQPHSGLFPKAKWSRSHSQDWMKTALSSVQNFCKPPDPRPPFGSHLPPSTSSQRRIFGHLAPWGNY